MDIYYRKVPTFEELPSINLSDYVFVRSISSDDLEDCWMRMQAEKWSPNGEVTELIRSLGLPHTSMSVGDLIYDGLEYWLCCSIGWRTVPVNFSEDSPCTVL